MISDSYQIADKNYYDMQFIQIETRVNKNAGTKQLN
jgi:hypothetical protein